MSYSVVNRVACAFTNRESGHAPTIVGIDADGKLGTTSADAAGNKVPLASLLGGQRQAMFNGKVEKLEARVTQQQQQIEILAAQLKEQAAQIQKVSARLELGKPAEQVVSFEQ